MAKTIKIGMSTKSINDAIKALYQYEVNFLRKIDLFVRMLANEGVQVALLEIRSSVGDAEPPQIELDLDESDDIISANIRMTGKDVLFVEFGAGISYNPQGGAPHAAEFGYGVGTYPGQKHAFDKGWWYKKGGVSVYSRGTQGTAPIYHAAETIRNNLILTALQLFREE